LKKYYFIAIGLLSAGLSACSHAHPVVPASEAKVTVRNDSDSRPVVVFWTATGCAGVDMDHGASSICHQEQIGSKQAAKYTFAQSTSDRSVLLYRVKELCALPHNSDLFDSRVPGDEVLRTDGCSLQQDSSESSMLSKPHER
jgi:hypothetical protein